MVRLFESTGDGGARAALAEGDAALLRSLFMQVLEMIGPGPAESDDPLAALFAEGPSRPPADPALARLFPDAYGDPEKPVDQEAVEASAEFRRYTETDLRTRKRDDALAVIRTLGGLGADEPLLLSAQECPRWLGATNDLRLILGTRLEVTEDDDFFALPDDDPAKPLAMAYLWLGALQESLLEAMAG
ncbi:DUF2017 domain-containing protein [Kitasatospora sp. NPDC002040]|uniref:DUF2017 domain-containing protein n=1 Tax=Kitasatospora sp. NPDC002040 TaxID=3154661 RepID=UPI0033204B43